MARPTTSKARGICKFYNTPTGCIAGRTCKFLHGDEELTPFDKAKTCKFYIAGFCKRGADCWFLHERPDRQQSATDEGSDDDTCGICYEKPTTYGLLAGCSHIFCVGCIKEWRDPRGKSEDIVSSGVTKRCPLCRAPSQFVTPSSLFFVQEQPQKRAVIDKYKASMAHVPCKYFEKSQKRFCPFGKDCFYQHLNNDGTPHTFKAGVNSLIRDRRYRELRRQLHTGGSSTSAHNPLPTNDFDAIIASLQSLAASVTEAAGRNGSNFPFALQSAHTEQTDQWASVSTPDADTALDRLADSIMSSLHATLFDHATRTVSSADEPGAPQVLQDFHIGPSSQVEEAASARLSRLFPSTDPIPADYLISRTSQSTPLGHVLSSPQLSTARPSSALGTSSRFSTTISNRSRSTPDNRVETRTVVPWATDSVLPMPCDLNEPTSSGNRELLVHQLAAVADNEDSTNLPSAELPLSSRNVVAAATPSVQDDFAPSEAAALVQDIDPPFMTDGRGRVVWSSATAGSRIRRNRTTTSTSTGAASSPARDKPRGDVQGREHSQVNSPVVRPVSLARLESEMHCQQV